MSYYFPDRRQLGTFTMIFPNKGLLKCNAFERWEDIDNGLTVRCGSKGTLQLDLEVGLTERHYATLTGSVSSSIGVEGIAGLSSKVEETIGSEVQWTMASKTTHTVAFEAPKCGRNSQLVYQYIREYELSYYRSRWLRSPEIWDRVLKEMTNTYDVLPDIDDVDDLCECDNPPQVVPYDGRLSVDLGRVSARVPFRHVGDGIEISFFGSTLLATGVGRAEFSGTFRRDTLPEILLILGGFSEEEVQATFTPYKEALGLELEVQAVSHNYTSPVNLLAL
ncbi:MAG TPA: hypothetical protein VFQ45_03385 [Longimicrobium sp.]|nr:hypothetical protein [Longimicrobium sp.]